MKNKEVEKAKNNEVALPSVDDWGEPAVVLTTNDLVIPKLLVMQGMSKLVMAGKGKFGDFRNSVTAEKYGDLETPMIIIPFHLTKSWMIETKLPNGKFKFNRFEDITVENDDLPWNDTELVAGVKTEIKRIRLQNFYCVTPEMVKKGSTLPLILTLKGSSARTGKEMTTVMYVENRENGKSPAAMAFKLSGTSVTNDDGTYIVMSAEKDREATAEEQAAALTMFKKLKQTDMKVDHSDITGVQDLPDDAIDEVSDQF